MVERDTVPNGSLMTWVAKINVRNISGDETKYATRTEEIADELLRAAGYMGDLKSVGDPAVGGGDINMSDRPGGASLEATFESMQEAKDVAGVLNAIDGVEAEVKEGDTGSTVYDKFDATKYGTILHGVMKAARNGMRAATESLQQESDRLKIKVANLESVNVRLQDENRVLRDLNEEMTLLQHTTEMQYRQESIIREYPELGAFVEDFDKCDTLDELNQLAERMTKLLTQKKPLDEKTVPTQNKPHEVSVGRKNLSGVPAIMESLEDTNAQGLSLTGAKTGKSSVVSEDDTLSRLVAHRRSNDK
jgi:hypothetical protein